MTWRTKLPAPIALNDGRTLTTLSEARALILSLPGRHQRNEHWQYAAGLLLDSAASGRSLKETADQLKIALRAEGLLDRPHK